MAARPREEPLLMVRARLARLDRELRRDVAVNGRHVYLLDLCAERLERRDGSADGVADCWLHMGQGVVPDQPDAQPADAAGELPAVVRHGHLGGMIVERV